MSAFSKVAYNSKAYAQFRPSYTDQLYQTIYEFHQGGYGKALDVATGTGQVTKALADKFEKVHGIDISETMLSEATKGDNITYSIGFAEELPFEDASVDLITVAEGAHWFNTKKFLKEVKRVLRPNGTLAIWGYSFCFIEGSSEKIRNSVEELGVNPAKLGNNWEAGREILDNFYRDSGWEELPNEFNHVLRYESPKKEPSALHIPDDSIFIELRSMEVWRFREYLKTWSSYKQYKEANLPGDLVDECVEFVKREYNPGTPLKEDDVLPLSWPQVLLLASNR
ncbi:S-adenosyl-L-methionine-dependent methyltransferase [Basidiobolus meristosporus CBS 931.73]|uniref:S-adenosyl-L-methionine-dependent methyltransferase n=1 Tax=Basidiobolus meristosporus CBS 931.73 TaxID=1314790 RepID=A0A1Y1YWR5_9FUNG|nr:S-adenosyl-L-methionine-dependent methyltransferase [Basidiobolus meristosporus CBS 931.73]|eukprot:ORY02508.1 S-adenosyl-L-methionine-dependent methyltransferase [Basidiobolus meristosporus CBS 931.73]